MSPAHWSPSNAATTSPPPHGGGIAIGLYLTGRLADAVKALEAKGITFVRRGDEGKAGRFAAFTDPDGNALYVAEMKAEYKDDSVGVR